MAEAAYQNWDVIYQFPQDGSSRNYVRVGQGSKTAIVMDYGLNQPVQELDDFVRLAAWLDAIGLRVPEIYDVDFEHGRALIEDFGNISMKAAIADGGNEARYYEAAKDILDYLAIKDDYPLLPGFQDGFEVKGQEQLAQFYVPLKTSRTDKEAMAREYWALWDEIQKDLPEAKMGFIHADYHAENLMVLPEEDGEIDLGIIDFQSAKYGPVLYDLGNLMEDMRWDVSRETKEEHLSGLSEADAAWYRILTTQFHCRLLGQIIRWDQQDGKSHYMQYLPRIERYIASALQDPVLAPLKNWFEDMGLDFAAQ